MISALEGVVLREGVLIVRDDEIRRRLREQNPWWATAFDGSPPDWQGADTILSGRVAWDLGYRARVLSDVASEPVNDRLVVVRGPRRVGKSVALKDVAAALCLRPDVDVRQVIYLATDAMAQQDVSRAVALGRDLTKSVGDAPRVWLLDEITGVPGWTQVLKYHRDQTAFSRDTVVCTGSSWDDQAEVERDLLAGRAGTASIRRIRFLLPMTFREYLAAAGHTMHVPSRVEPWDLQGSIAGTNAEQAAFSVDELDLAWQDYLTCGGFPRAVAEHHREGRVSDSFIADLGAWLHRDVDPSGSEDSVPLLLAELNRRSTSPLNRTDAATALGYGSRQVFDIRVNRLVSRFAALWCHQVDEEGLRVKGSQSKLYLTDPLLAWLPTRMRSGIPEPNFPQLSESALAVALARAVDRLEPGRWITNDAIGYNRTGGDREIDLSRVPVRTPAGPRFTTPIESKWVSRKWRQEALTVEGKFGAGVLATKDLVDIDHPAWALPAPLVALLLG